MPGISNEIISNQITEVILKCERLNYINNKSFIKNKIQYFLKKGLSMKVIENKLKDYNILPILPNFYLNCQIIII